MSGITGSIRRLGLLTRLFVPLLLCAQEEQAIQNFESLIKAEKFAEARSAVEVFVETHPRSWQAWYQLGYAEFRLHDYQASLTHLCKSLELNTGFADSHKILAYDLNILGRQDLALRELERTIAIDAGSAEGHYEMGRIYYEQGSYFKAIDHLEKAKALDPGNVRVYHNLGLAYAAVADNVKAVSNFEAGLKLNAVQPKPSAWPLIDYATYFNLQGDFGRARDLLVQAIQIDPSWEQEFDELSRAYRGLGQTSEAIEALQKAVALNPRKPEYHYSLARLYTQVHKPEEAKQQLQQYEQDKGTAAK